jgi:hypothetical protein
VSEHIRIRANRSTGELEIEGSLQVVAEWWERLWPQLREIAPAAAPVIQLPRQSLPTATSNAQHPEVFGEYFSEFRSDVTDVDKVLIAGVFVQGKDPERVFSTKNANQLLLDQNIKVANASECVRRLLHTKRAFVVSEGKFRVSATGFDHLKTLKAG